MNRIAQNSGAIRSGLRRNFTSSSFLRNLDPKVPPQPLPTVPPVSGPKVHKVSTAIPPAPPAPPAKPPLPPSTPPPPAAALPPKPPKKSRSGLKFALGTTLFLTAFYGIGVWLSLDDEGIYDNFTEYVPFALPITTYFEDLRYAQRQSKMPSSTSAQTSAKRPLPDGVKEEVVTLPRSGAVVVSVKEAPKKTIQDFAKEAKVENKAESKAEATSGKGKQKPAVPAKAGSSSKSEGTAPPSNLPLVNVSSPNSAVDAFTKEINSIISSLNSSKAPTGDEIAKISSALEKLSQQLVKAESAAKQALQKSLDSQAQKFNSLGQAQISDIEQQLSVQMAAELKKMQESYEGRLATEIEATKNAVITRAESVIAAVNAQREKEFSEKVTQLVDSERNGRLSKLDELAKSVHDVQELFASSDAAFAEYERAADLNVAVGKLTAALRADAPLPLAPYLKQIQAAGQHDELVESAVASIPESAAVYGVLSPAQLAARFRLLEPEIIKASMLPDDAGIAGHVGSWIFSHLLWEKEGNPVGDDVDSLIARTNTALSEGRVIDAVVEVNSLKGWPKRLAHDWLEDARRRSETEFAVSVLEVAGELA